MPEQKRWLVRLTSAPYFSPRAANGIDAILACGAFGQPVDVVIEGDGLALLREHQEAPEHERNLYRQLASLPLYDIAQVYVLLEQSAPASPEAIEELALITIDEQRRAALISGADHVLSF